MNKAFYISGIVLSIVFIAIGTYYADEVLSAKYWDLFSYSDYDFGYGSSSRYKDLTIEGGLWSLFFFLFFIASDLLGLIKIKTTTSKVLSIIGLSISGILLLWNFVMMFSDGGITYDEVFPAYIFYCVMMLAFSIVGLVQSVRYAKKIKSGSKGSVVENKDLLDS